jgi:dTDP-4-dehydrorhamnose 3,5-epimerase
MKVTPCGIAGLLVIEPNVFGDDRGFFMETWNQRRYAEAGLPTNFVQDNVSSSRRGSVRGLHFQNPAAQAKLVWVIQGEVFDVAVDIRRSSPTFGQWHGVTLSAENRLQFYIPTGFAHGFAVTSELALFAYKCTDFYAPAHDATILWNDPAIGITWPVAEPVLSPKDQRGIRLQDLPPERLFP